MNYLLLISGAGRNVGKTTLACRLIEKYKKQIPLTAVKISAHFHELTPLQKIIIQQEGLIISEEHDRASSKDSSRYLQAGAFHSFYVQSTAKNIPLVYQWMRKNLNGLVICESASLGSHVIPDQAVFVSGTDSKKQPVWTYPFQTTILTEEDFIPEISLPEPCINTIFP
jgi:hypothetical protein